MPEEVGLGADRQLDRHRVGAQAVDHGLDALSKSAPMRSILLM